MIQMQCPIPVDDPTGWWMSEKLDGVRAHWDGKQLSTRTGRPINAPQWLIDALPRFAVQGELWAGRGTFQRVSGTVRRSDPGLGLDWIGVKYMIFDAPSMSVRFESRIRCLDEYSQRHPSEHVEVIDQVRCTGRDHLHDMLETIIGDGGEGVMLVRGRGRWLDDEEVIIKVKPVQDLDAIVVGYVNGNGRNADRVGAIIAETSEGSSGDRGGIPAVRFRVGTGLSDAQRDTPPPIGSTIKVGHDSFTDRGIPRFPRLLGIRAD